MSKKYLLSEEDLQNLIHESIGFFSDKAKAAVQSGKTIMFSDRVRWIQEFLKEALNEIPVDKLFNELDEKLSSYCGSSIDEIKERVRQKEPSAVKEQKAVKAYLKELE